MYVPPASGRQLLRPSFYYSQLYMVQLDALILWNEKHFQDCVTIILKSFSDCVKLGLLEMSHYHFDWMATPSIKLLLLFTAIDIKLLIF